MRDMAEVSMALYCCSLASLYHALHALQDAQDTLLGLHAW